MRLPLRNDRVNLLPPRPDPTNAERQRRYRENQKKLRERYVTGTGIDPAPIQGILKEIKRKRKEIYGPLPKGTWRVPAISKLQLAKLVDWIEDELAKIPGAISAERTGSRAARSTRRS